MKQFWKEFLKRGLLSAAGGPMVLAVIYGISGAAGQVSQIAPEEACLGILSATLLAFVAAGMTAVYQTEKLPLPIAILLHGGVLYLDYILIYLLNGWLQRQVIPILVFTAAFLLGYALIWLIILCINKVKTDKVNRLLKEEGR